MLNDRQFIMIYIPSYVVSFFVMKFMWKQEIPFWDSTDRNIVAFISLFILFPVVLGVAKLVNILIFGKN